VRHLGELLKQASSSAAYNVKQESLEKLVEEIGTLSPELAGRAKTELLEEVRMAPTLVKYVDSNPYEIETRRELLAIAAELLAHQAPESSPAVDLVDPGSLEIELATTLIYEHCCHPYRQVRRTIEGLETSRRQEIIDAGLRHRGPHDEMLRNFRAGQQFCFDNLMDIGGFRDLHRHRRCIQIEQRFTTRHGYDIPPELGPAGALEDFRAAMARARDRVETLAQSPSPEARENSEYAIPLGFRKRTLFKMDFAQAVYIAELRTTPAGHFSYRRVAYEMFQAVSRKHPSLAAYFRVHDLTHPVDLLKR
jgi:hypothetical protein